jgi:hypothetical protein
LIVPLVRSLAVMLFSFRSATSSLQIHFAPVFAITRLPHAPPH